MPLRLQLLTSPALRVRNSCVGAATSESLLIRIGAIASMFTICDRIDARHPSTAASHIKLLLLLLYRVLGLQRAAARSTPMSSAGHRPASWS